MTRLRTTLAALSVGMVALTGTATAGTAGGVNPTPNNPAGCKVTTDDPFYALSHLVGMNARLNCRLPVENPDDDLGALSARFRLRADDGSYPFTGPANTINLWAGDVRAKVINREYCEPGADQSWKAVGTARYQFDGGTFMVRDTSDAVVITCAD